MRLCVHWRHRHVTAERTAAVATVLAAHPGDDDVVINVTGTGQTLKLPVTVDARARTLVRELHHATGETGMAHLIDPELLWPNTFHH